MTITMLAAVACLFVPQLSMAKDPRIQDELRDPAPTLNPMVKALGNKGYEQAMKSGKYRYTGNAKCRLCHREFFFGR